jgi:hypothetical protein
MKLILNEKKKERWKLKIDLYWFEVYSVYSNEKLNEWLLANLQSSWILEIDEYFYNNNFHMM